MRGRDERSGSLFSYVDLESRVPASHPLRVIRRIADEVLTDMSGAFDTAYAPLGRPSIPPERLLRALLLQAFYTIRSERQLMERLDFDLLFRWFVGLSVDDPVWDASSFAKNRERFLAMEAAARFLAGVVAHPEIRRQMRYRLPDQEIFGLVAAARRCAVDGLRGALLLGHRDKGLASLRDGVNGVQELAHGCHDGDLGRLTAGSQALVEVSEPWVVPDGSERWHPERGPEPGVADIRDAGTLGLPLPGEAQGGDDAVSQRIRKRIEEIFGWLNTVAGWRKSRFRGLGRTEHGFHLALAAYNLTRMPKLLT
jgi:transposase